MTRIVRNVGLSAKKRLAIEALLSGYSHSGAANQAGVSERTLRRWLSDPVFSDALRAAEREALNITTRRLLALSGKATQALFDGMDDPKGAVRVRSADITLGRVFQYLTLGELEARLVALEERLKHEEG